MTLLMIVLIVGTVAVLVWHGQCAETRRQRLLAELHHADRAVEAEYRQARRAMNDAANQSWRNLAEFDG